MMRQLFRLAVLGAALTGIFACQPPTPGLLPLEQPSVLQAAPPRINGEVAADKGQQRVFEDRGVAAQPTAAPSPPPPAVSSNSRRRDHAQLCRH